METIYELSAKIIADATELDKALKQSEKDFNNLGKTADKQTTNISKDFKEMGKIMVVAGGAITASFGLMIKQASSLESVRISFNHLTSASGQAGDEIVSALKKASAGTVAESDLMQSANKAMLLGVGKNTEDFSTLMEIARDRAKAMGLTTTQAFDDIVKGIGRGSPLILDNLGILVDAITANKEYAASIGKTAEQLTEAEKTQALLNQVLEQGKSSMNKSAQTTLTTSEQFQKLQASIKDLSGEIGTTLLPLVNDLVGSLTNVTKGITNVAKSNPELTKNLSETSLEFGLMTTAVGLSLVAFSKLKDFSTKLGSSFGSLLGKISVITLGLTAIAELVKRGFNYQFAINNMHEMESSMSNLYQSYLDGKSTLEEYRDSVESYADSIESYTKSQAMWLSKSAEEQNLTAVKNLRIYIDELNKTIETNTKITEQNTVTQEIEAEKIEELKTQAEELIKTWQYENSEAGKLEVSMEDVYGYLLKIGKSSNEVIEIYKEFGTDTSRLTELLNSQGISLRNVAWLYGNLAEVTNDAIEKEKKYKQALIESTQAEIERAIAMQDSMGKRFGLSEDNYSISRDIALQKYTGYLNNPALQNILNSQGLEAWASAINLGNYDSGGVVPGNIGQPQLAMVHGGEEILTPEQRGQGNTYIVNGSVLVKKEIGEISLKYGRNSKRKDYTTGL